MAEKHSWQYQVEKSGKIFGDFVNSIARHTKDGDPISIVIAATANLIANIARSASTDLVEANTMLARIMEAIQMKLREAYPDEKTKSKAKKKKRN